MKLDVPRGRGLSTSPNTEEEIWQVPPSSSLQAARVTGATAPAPAGRLRPLPGTHAQLGEAEFYSEVFLNDITCWTRTRVGIGKRKERGCMLPPPPSPARGDEDSHPSS